MNSLKKFEIVKQKLNYTTNLLKVLRVIFVFITDSDVALDTPAPIEEEERNMKRKSDFDHPLALPHCTAAFFLYGKP